VLALGPGCYVGLDDGGDEYRTGFPDRWKMTPDVSELSRDTRVAINDSPAGAHRDSNCTGTFTAGAQVLADYIEKNFDGVVSMGGYNCRPINHDPRRSTSIHGLGRALDIHVTCETCEAPNGIGDPIAHWLIANAEAIGVQRIIWDNSSWKAVGYEHTVEYGGGGLHDHNDHLHVEINLEAARMDTPWYEGGGHELPPVVPDGCDDSCYPEYAVGRHCMADGLEECGDFDGDGCTEWKSRTTCDLCGGNPGKAHCCAGHFCDDDDHLFEGAIDHLASEGIVVGCGEDASGGPRYCPSDAATRAEVVVMLARATGMPPMDSPDAFTDDDGHWAERSLNAAFHHGVTQGIGDGKFGPDQKATRTHVAAFIANTYGLPAATADYFDDDDDDAAWVQDVHNRLYQAGITSGCADREFCGSDAVTRGALAAFVSRSHKNLARPSW
jgi:hypothetical protein